MAVNGAKPRGPGVAEITKRLSTPKLRPGEFGPGIVNQDGQRPVGVMDKLKELSQQHLEEKIAAAEIASIDADTEARRTEVEVRKNEAQVKLLESQARLKALSEQGKAEGSLSPEMQLIVTLMERQFEAANSKSQDDGMGPMASVLEEVVNQLAEMRKSVQDIIMGQNDKGDPQETLVGNIQQLAAIKDLFESLWPHEKPVEVTGASRDLETTLMLQKTQLEIERIRAQIDIERVKMDREYSIREKELELEAQKNVSLKNGLDSLFQNFAPIAKDLVDRLALQGSSPGGIPQRVAATQPMVAMETPQVVDMGPTPSQPEMKACPQCQGQIAIYADRPTATCEGCGAVFEVQL